MSYSFYVPVYDPTLNLSSILPRLGPIACANGDELPDEIGPSLLWHLYRPGESTRSVEVGIEDGQFSARVMSMSSASDYRLGRDLAAAVGELVGSDVVPEDGDPTPPQQLVANYGDQWIDEHIRSIGRMMISMVANEHSTLTLSGAVRPFCFGPRMLAETRGDLAAVYDRMLASQNLGSLDDPPFDASVMEISPDGGEPFTTSAWGPGVDYVFPEVDTLTIITDTECLMIPFESIFELAPRARRIDETHVFVRAIEGDAWRALCGHAALLAVDAGTGDKPRRPWWKFWG